MNRSRAEKNIRLAVFLNVLAVLVSVAATILAPVVHFDVHLFAPWLFPGVLGLPLLVVLTGLTIAVHRRSRTGAVLLLAVYLLGRVFLFPALYGYSGAFRVAWLLMALAWVPAFVPGIRGTLAYHRPRGGAAVRPTRPPAAS